MRMKCFLIFPEIWARTLRWPARSTRNIVPGNTWVTVPSVTICSSFGIGQIYLTTAFLSTWQILFPLTELIDRHLRQILAQLLAFPPCPGLPPLLRRRESIAEETGTNVARRRSRKGISLQQIGDLAFVLQQTKNQANKPL